MINLSEFIFEKLHLRTNKDIKLSFQGLQTSKSPRKSNNLLDNDELNKNFISSSKTVDKKLNKKAFVDDCIKNKKGGPLTVLQFEHDTHDLIKKYTVETEYADIDLGDGRSVQILTALPKGCKSFLGNNKYYIYDSSDNDDRLNDIVSCHKVIKSGIYVWVFNEKNVQPFIAWFKNAVTDDINYDYGFTDEELSEIEDAFNKTFEEVYYSFKTTTSLIIKSKEVTPEYVSIQKNKPNEFVIRVKVIKEKSKADRPAYFYGPFKTINEAINELIKRIKIHNFYLDFKLKNN